MMQYDRRPTAGKQPAKNFMAINKSSVKSKSHQSVIKREKQKQDEVQKDSKILRNQGRQRDSRQNVPPSSAGKKSSGNEETVTVSKDYLEKLLRETLAKGPPPEINITDHHSIQYPQPVHSGAQSQSHEHVVIDHNQIPGLGGSTLHRHEPKFISKDESAFALPNVRNSQSFDQIQTSTSGLHVSPRGSDSYHRGTTNRPVHPAMRSQIVFGAGSGWGEEEEREKQREREVAKTRWMNEIAEQMQAHNPQNPVSVTGRGGDGPVSVGLQLQKSPRELGEQKFKELEHKDFLLAQIEDRRRKKEEERLKKEREEREEERRVARERERLTREFEVEKEMQRRKEIEAANKAALLQQRIKMAEQSARAAKEEKRKMKLGPQQSQQQVVSNNRQIEVDNPTAIDNYNEQYNNQRYVVPSKFEVDLRSPSLHTIPPSQSYEKSPSHNNVTSVRNSYEKLGTKASRVLPPPKKATVLLTNSQVSLYSTSSEEPVTAMNRRSKPKPDPTAKNTGPNSSRDSRIPRKNILRKQLEKNLHERNKYDSESEGKIPLAKRRITNHSQTPNSVAKSRVKHDRTGGHRHQQHRPSSTESQEDQLPRAHGIKGHSHSNTKNVNMKVDDYKKPPQAPQCSSPPVPAVARRLAQSQSVRFSNQVEDIHDSRNSGMNNDEEGSIVYGNTSHDHQPQLPNIRQTAQRQEVCRQDSESKIEELKLPKIIQTSAANIDDPSSKPFPTIPEVTITSFPSMNIERAPSCSPDDRPLNITTNELSHNRAVQDVTDWSYKNGVCSLPPIKEVMSREEKRDSVTRTSTGGGTSTSSRQKEIVAQLMKLRQGILSQSQTVNSRISSLVPQKRTHF